MPQVEYGDFYKFIVSVGVALVVLALLLPWLFIREPFDLLLDSNQIGHLTPAAQAIIAQRQHLLSRIFPLVPWISALLLSIGTGLVITGLAKWRRRQVVRDQSEELTLEKLKRELTAMSPEQVEAKLEANVEQERGTVQLRSDLVASTKQILQLERKLLERIWACFGNSHDLLANQRLGNVEYDVILQSKNRQEFDIVIEMKYIRQGFHFGWLRESVDRLLVATAFYRERLRRRAMPLLLIITAESAEPSEAKFEEMRDRVSRSFAKHEAVCRIERLRESEVESIDYLTLHRVIFGKP